MKITPFNGDSFIGVEIAKLIERFGVKTIIETGTWSGHTTRAFRKLLSEGEVITIDNTTDHLKADFGPNAVSELTALGIRFIVGDSGVELPGLIRTVKHPILCYLDAHGGGSNPLKEEIMALADSKKTRNKCVICIHDFHVPGKIWGYNHVDYGRGPEPLGMPVVEPWLNQVWPNGFEFHMNENADGCQRGILYAYPKTLQSGLKLMA